MKTSRFNRILGDQQLPASSRLDATLPCRRRRIGSHHPWFAAFALFTLLHAGLWNRCDAQNVIVHNTAVGQSYPNATYPSVTYPATSYPGVSYPSGSYPSSSSITQQPVAISSLQGSLPSSPQGAIVHQGTVVGQSTWPVAPPLPSTQLVTGERRGFSQQPASQPSPRVDQSNRSAITESVASRTWMTGQTVGDRSASYQPTEPRNMGASASDILPRGRTSSSANRLNISRRVPEAQLASARRTYYPKQPMPYGTTQNTMDAPVTVLPYRTENIQAARRTAERYQQLSTTASRVAGDLLSENAILAVRWADLAEQYLTLSGRVDDAQSKYNETARDYEDVNAKLSHYGLTSTIGQLLRSKKEHLNAWRVADSQSLFVSQELDRSRDSQLELEMNRASNANVDTQANQMLSGAGYDTSDVANSRLVMQVRDLLEDKNRWVSDLQQGYRDYQTKLGSLDTVTTESASLAKDYRKLINRHITWIRSGDPVSVGDVSDLKDGTAALFDAGRSADFGPTLQRKLRANSIGSIGLLVTLLVIMLIRWRAKSWLLGIGSRHRMRESTTSSRRAAASFLTVIIAFAFPAMLYSVSRWLGNGIVSQSTLAASSAFAAAALTLLLFEICRQLLRKQGFLDKHVDVEIPGSQRATNYLTLIGFGLAVVAYAVTLMSQVDHGLWRASVGRFGFMFAMLIVAYAGHLAFRPQGGFAEPLIAKFGGGVIHRVRWVIYFAALACPIAMIGLAAIGYGFTATELTRRAAITLSACLIAATLWSGVKVLSANAWQLLTGTKNERRKTDEYGPINPNGGLVTGNLAEHSLELKHHLAFLCQCALVLGVIVCFGWIWIDVFPNVRMGNPVVWTVQDTVSQASIDATGRTFVETVDVDTPITALHLLLAAGTLWVAFQLAKLLPSLFDALVLQRVSFDEGMEHFSLVLGRALLFGAGCLIACKVIGVRWQVVQWLAVGLTIGLGFGLQDMVRNLFGGFVVLFEKPARLGDLITVGKVTGRVAEQKLRTTVLSDDNGREVIVPNKNFVSEDVVNWMGAGRLQLVAIEVAATRDERPADLCRSLQELAVADPDVLITPAPQATLVCVAKGSQRIEIRVWVEENQHVDRFQEHLLQVTRGYLREKNWWIANQPSQPSLDPNDTELGEARSQIKRRRKRSA